MGYMRHWAKDCDDQLPIFSTIGKGPKGEDGVDGQSIKVRRKETEIGTVLEFYSDPNGDLIYTTPDISGGEITFYQDPIAPEPGDDINVIMVVKKDGEEPKQYEIMIPKAVRGAAIHSCTEPQERSGTGVYVLPKTTVVFNNELRNDLMIGDLVFIQIKENYGNNAALGVITAVNKDDIVIDVRNEYDTKAPWIGYNNNWFIGNTDTGVSATGTPGPAPYIGPNGNWFVESYDTGVQAQGPIGKGIVLKGAFDTFEDLMYGVPSAEDGDAYTAGSHLYVWYDSRWVDQGGLGIKVNQAISNAVIESIWNS